MQQCNSCYLYYSTLNKRYWRHSITGTLQVILCSYLSVVIVSSLIAETNSCWRVKRETRRARFSQLKEVEREYLFLLSNASKCNYYFSSACGMPVCLPEIFAQEIFLLLFQSIKEAPLLYSFVWLGQNYVHILSWMVKWHPLSDVTITSYNFLSYAWVNFK